MSADLHGLSLPLIHKAIELARDPEKRTLGDVIYNLAKGR